MAQRCGACDNEGEWWYRRKAHDNEETYLFRGKIYLSIYLGPRQTFTLNLGVIDYSCKYLLVIHAHKNSKNFMLDFFLPLYK